MVIYIWWIFTTVRLFFFQKKFIEIDKTNDQKPLRWGN